MLGISHPLIYFPMYEFAKIYLKENWDNDNPDPDSLSTKYVVVSALTCKMVASLCTYPHEVIRARSHDIRAYEMSKNKVAFSKVC